MPLRLYLTPIIGDGLTEATAYRPKLDGLAGVAYSVMIPHKPDGSPQFVWALATVRATAWAALDGDATHERLFGVDLPDTIDTFAELKAFLQSKTVADIPQVRRTALNTRLTDKGIDTSAITLSTTWWAVLRGIQKMLNNGVLPGNDGPQV